MRILHVIREVTNGGASLGLHNMCRDGPSGFAHEVLSLIPPSSGPLKAFAQAGIPVFDQTAAPGLLARADVVQVEWWNSPEMVRFLLSDLPSCRIQLHSRAHFDAPLMCPSQAILERVDSVSVSTPSAALNPAYRRLESICGLPPASCIHSGAVRTIGAANAPRIETGQFGYLGTIEDIKMHRSAMSMIAQIIASRPGAEFVFAGDGLLADYQAQARALGIEDRVSFLGFVGDVGAFFAQIDLMLYPLNPFTYATSEKAVQEAMLHGVPVAAFPHGGLRDLLTGDCALLVDSEAALVDGTIALMGDPERRRRLADTARRRIAEWPVSRDWRQHAAEAWRATARLPPRQRRIAYPDDDTAWFALSHEPAACPPPSGPLRQDFAAVAAFVLDEYRRCGLPTYRAAEEPLR